MTTFTELGLDARLLRSLETEGYTTPTPIQAQAIAPVMAGSDLLGIAQTGTGKTAAFALPILHRLAMDKKPAPRRGCRVLVLSPTRELASQIAESFRTYGRHMGITVATVYGGVGHRPQITATARGVDVIVATPGRLLDHTEQRNIVLACTEIFVLDEADQMLDLGFVLPIRKVVAQMTGKRQNLFFSATMPGEIGKLAGELLHNPVKVSVAPAATTVERVVQRVIHVERHKKRAVLVELLANADMKRALVFTRTKRGADKVAEHLEAASISVAAIHGNKSQGQRERALEQFRRSEIRVLVATDIAARGIDIDQVSHVINFELPDVPEAYVHRIGRTARAGAEGVAISLCDHDERGQLRDIERLTRQSIPHENRITGDVVPLDTTGAPRGADRGARARSSGNGRGHGASGNGRGNGGGPKSGGERRAQGQGHGQGHRGRPDRDGQDARAPRAEAWRPERATQQTREARAEHGRPERDGPQTRAPRAQHGRPDRDSQQKRAPRADHGRRGDGAIASENAPFGTTFRPDAPAGRDNGERARNGNERGARGFAPRGERNGHAGDRKPNGGGNKPQGDRRDRSDAPKPAGFKPRGEGSSRREGGEPRGAAGGKPGGFNGLKRKSGDKPVWSNRP